MSDTAHRFGEALAPAPAADAPALTIALHSGAGAFEAEWRRLEATALCTPYQRFDWVDAYARHALAETGDVFQLVSAFQGGRLVALLPLVLRRRHGVRLLSFIGGRHANFHMPVLERRFAAGLTPAEAEALLMQAAKAIRGVDGFAFINQPVRWDGIANPFAALNSRPSPSHAYRLDLFPDEEETLRKAMSAHARKNHRRKRARLEEIGSIESFVAATAQERAEVIAAFLDQKTRRFAEQGLPDVFAGAGIRAFLHAGSTPPAEGAEPAMILAGLRLEGAIVATYIGARHQGRFSGMATAFDDDPRLQRYSPGEMLLVDLIRLQCRAGLTEFDLGVGEAQYKASICDITDEIADGFIPATAKGQAYAAAGNLWLAAKTWVKARPGLHAFGNRVRRAIGG